MKKTKFHLSLGAVLILVALAVALTLMRPRRTEVTDVKPGAGRAAKPGDTLVLHYVGRLADGREFDNSKARGAGIPVRAGPRHCDPRLGCWSRGPARGRGPPADDPAR
jgi:hypothetical protein